MAFPVGVITREVTFGVAAENPTGDALEMTVTVTPSRSMVWGATGAPVIAAQRPFTAASGLEGSFRLPVTDQDGWEDGNGNILSVVDGAHTHAYLVQIAYKDANGRPLLASVPQKTIVVPQGDGSPIDLDKAIPVTSTSGVVVSIPDEWTAKVDLAVMSAATAAGAAEAAAGALIDSDAFVAEKVADPESLTGAALSATFATVINAPAPTGDAAIDTANLVALAEESAGINRTILLKSGTYVVSNLPLKTGLHWAGQGWAETILKLAPSANAAVLVTENWATLTGTSVTSLLNAPYGFRITDLTVDGNKQQQTNPPAAINIYGHSYSMDDVHVRNAHGVGVRSEFGLNGSIATDIGLPSYEPRVNNVDIHHCGSWGWHHKGPTDAFFSRLVIWKCGEAVESGAFWLERGNGVNFNHCHTFGNGGWSLIADAQFFSTATQWEISEKRAHAPQSGGVWIRFDDCVIVGGGIYFISGPTVPRDGIGLRLGDQANGKFAVRAWIDTVIYGVKGADATTAGIHFNGSAAAVVRAHVSCAHPDGAASAVMPIAGTPDAGDTVSIRTSGVAADYDINRNAGAALVPKQSVRSASYTLTATDVGTVVEMDSSTAMTVTIPTDAAVPMRVGTTIKVFRRQSAGQVTIAGASGVTLVSPTGFFTTRAQYSTVVLRKRAANFWVLEGDISTS